MTLQAGTIGGAFTSGAMSLTFSAQIWRAVETVTPIGSKQSAYTINGGILPCDVIPLNDEIRFEQAGQTEVVTHILHFHENADVQSRDIVQRV